MSIIERAGRTLLAVTVLGGTALLVGLLLVDAHSR
jgi:hypothetical protein